MGYFLCLFYVCFSFTLEPSPPGQPESTTVQSKSISFSYSKPKHENGNITHQEIEVTYIPYDVCSTSLAAAKPYLEIILLPLETSDGKFIFSLESLQPYWEYSVRVRVNTSAGFSNFSESFSVQTLPGSMYLTLLYKEVLIWFKFLKNSLPLMFNLLYSHIFVQLSHSGVLF